MKLLQSIKMSSVCALGATFLLAGCNSPQSSTSTNGATASDSGAAGSSNSAASAKAKNIGVTVQNVANPFFIALVEGAETEGKKIGATVTMQDGQQEIGTQTNVMDDLIQKQVDLIVLNAVDSSGIGPSVKRAREAGIPVVAVDVGAEGGVNATITSDNVQAGELAAEYMVKRLKGKGNIALIDGPPVTAVQDRVQGLKNVLKKNPGIKLVSTQVGDASRDRALQLGTNILTANPKLDAVFAIADPTALGMELAARQANRKDFFIVSIDGSPDVVQSMKKPDSLIVASSAQNPRELGRLAIEIGAQIVEGKKPEKSTIKLPVKLVTKENLSTYKGW